MIDIFLRPNQNIHKILKFYLNKITLTSYLFIGLRIVNIYFIHEI